MFSGFAQQQSMPGFSQQGTFAANNPQGVQLPNQVSAPSMDATQGLAIKQLPYGPGAIPIASTSNNVSAGYTASQLNVNRAIAQALDLQNDDTGECLDDFLTEGVLIDDKIKLKIWNGDYIDLALLRKKLPDPVYRVDNVCPHVIPPQNKLRPPSNISDWVSLFSIYAEIYVQQWTGAAGDMFAYINRIAGLQKTESGFIWRHYDEQFRKIQSKYRNDKNKTMKLSWGTVHSKILSGAKELDQLAVQNFRKNQNASQSPPAQTAARGQSNSNDFQSPKNGTCDRYNKGSCTFNPCRYKHVCGVCFKRHPSIKCRQNSSAQRSEGQQNSNQ
ncbi:MAG: hypothetical protein GY702_21255 [Desulfobulbaceae bacterium]|nr:hypothetical protein [Desulfobulbaceae bacterium]